jgi:hypothetical protein
MSANRSVQAAQRRQTAPSSAPQQRGPQPSINSSQHFSQPSNSGKLAGQQAALAQKQQMQQQQMQQQQQQQQGQGGLDGITKMTVPQAITLITLRLGKLETNMFHQQYVNSEHSSNGSQIDESLIESIMDRLDAIEKRDPTASVATATGSTANADIILLKQQFEALKPVLTQLKTASTSIAKENKSLKQQIETLKSELDETKELVITLQNITMDNSQKIMTFAFTNDDQLFSINDEEAVEAEADAEHVSIVSDSEEVDEPKEVNEPKELGLKEIVEQELNA